MNRITLTATPAALGFLLTACAGSQAHTEPQTLTSTEVGTMTVVTTEEVDEEAQPSSETAANTGEAPPATDCGGATVYFATDSASLDGEASTRLERLSQCIGDEARLTIEVSGHADPRGSEKHNAQLSEARAKTVRDFLESKGVDAATYEVRAKGEQEASEEEGAWQEDRRTEIELEE